MWLFVGSIAVKLCADRAAIYGLEGACLNVLGAPATAACASSAAHRAHALVHSSPTCRRRFAQRLRAHDPARVYNAHHAARHAHRHRMASAIGGDAADAPPLRDRRTARAHARAAPPLPHLRITRVGHRPGSGAHARAPAAAAAPRRARVARRRLAHQRRRSRGEHSPVADRRHLLERGLLRLAQLPARTEIAPISR